MIQREIDMLTARLTADVRYLTGAAEKIRTSIRLGARWEGAADMAYMLGRDDVERACVRAVTWLDATAAYLRGGTWPVRPAKTDH